jgi:hypothetical protein
VDEEDIRHDYQEDDSAEMSIRTSYRTVGIKRLITLEDAASSDKGRHFIISLTAGER